MNMGAATWFSPGALSDMLRPAPPARTTALSPVGPNGRKPTPTSKSAVSRMPDSEPVEATTWLTAPAEKSVPGSPDTTVAQPSSTASWANSRASTVSSDETAEKSQSLDQAPPLAQMRLDMVQAGYSAWGGKPNGEAPVSASARAVEYSSTSSQVSGASVRPAAS